MMCGDPLSKWLYCLDLRYSRIQAQELTCTSDLLRCAFIQPNKHVWGNILLCLCAVQTCFVVQFTALVGVVSSVNPVYVVVLLTHSTHMSDSVLY